MKVTLGGALLRELQDLLPEQNLELPATSQLWVDGSHLSKTLGGRDRRTPLVDAGQISMTSVRRRTTKESSETSAIRHAVERWQRDRALDPSVFESMEAARVLANADWKRMSARLLGTKEGAGLEPLLRLARYDRSAWTDALEHLLGGPVTDLTFLSDQNPLWKHMPDDLRSDLARWTGSQISKIPRQREPASTQLNADRVARVLLARFLDPRPQFAELGSRPTPTETRRIYEAYLGAVRAAGGLRETLDLDRIMELARITQRALRHQKLGHVDQPTAYLFGSTTMGLAIPKKSDADIVFAEDYFQYFYDMGRSGGFAKAEVDAEIYRAIDAIDPRPIGAGAFTTTSVMITPAGFAVTSPIMLEVRPNEISLVLFPFEYETGKNRVGDDIFEVKTNSAIERLPIG